MPNNPQKRILVLGASGNAGRSVLEALTLAGHQAVGVSRTGGESRSSPFEWVKGDLLDVRSMRSHVRQADAVICCAMPAYTRWPQDFPKFTDAIIKSLEGQSAPLVFCDNLYAYGPSFTRFSESTPMWSKGGKGIARRINQETLERAHEDGRIKLAIGKAADFFGPGVAYPHIEKLYRAILEGKRPMILGDGASLHSISYLPDVARGLITLATSPDALGNTWHLPVAPALSEIEHIAILQKLASPSAPLLTPKGLSFAVTTILGFFAPMIRELKEVHYQHTQEFVVDCSKFQDKFGWEATPLADALGATLDWWRHRLKN